jgi:hypothetical protein
VDANDLSISVTQGEIKLNNVEVKSSAFDDLELPITIKSGTVGQIHIKLSWTKLTSSPIVVTITDIYVVVCPNTARKQANPNDAHDKTSHRLLLAAEMERQKNELLQGSSATPGDTSDAGMVKKMLNNMIIKIKNVHMRYEQNVDDQPGVSHTHTLSLTHTHTHRHTEHTHAGNPKSKQNTRLKDAINFRINILHVNTCITCVSGSSGGWNSVR